MPFGDAHSVCVSHRGSRGRDGGCWASCYGLLDAPVFDCFEDQHLPRRPRNRTRVAIRARLKRPRLGCRLALSGRREGYFLEINVFQIRALDATRLAIPD